MEKFNSRSEFIDYLKAKGIQFEPMSKEQLIDFLNKKAVERESLSRWVKENSNRDNIWVLDRPFIDELQDELEIYDDGTVKIRYNQSLNGSGAFVGTYDKFVDNYDITLR